MSPASSPEKDTVDAVDNDDDEPEYIPSPVKSKKSAPTSKQVCNSAVVSMLWCFRKIC